MASGARKLASFAEATEARVAKRRRRKKAVRSRPTPP
jgi:hypothetical protein